MWKEIYASGMFENLKILGSTLKVQIQIQKNAH